MPQQDQLLRSPFVICTFGSGSGASRDPGLFRHVRSTGHTGHGGSYRTTTVSIRSSTCCNGGSRGSCIGTRTGSCSRLPNLSFLFFVALLAAMARARGRSFTSFLNAAGLVLGSPATCDSGRYGGGLVLYSQSRHEIGSLRTRSITLAGFRGTNTPTRPIVQFGHCFQNGNSL